MKSISRKAISAVYRILHTFEGYSGFLPLPDKELEQRNSQDLKSTIKKIDEHEKATASLTTTTWTDFRRALRQSILTKDTQSFLSWPEVATSMFYIAPIEEWITLRKSQLWKDHRDALHESSVGTPAPYRAYPSTSGNLIHHAYHIALFMKACEVNPASFQTIVEIGGGYGGMCRLLHKLGFKGRYGIFDLPEFNALQRYFLSTIGLLSKARIDTFSDTAKLDSFRDADLAIMTWSASEMPTSLRDDIFNRIKRPGYLLIAYQKQFENIDNAAYFKNIQEEIWPGYSWHEHEIAHLPGNFYLFGKKLKD